jgi:hypothetical protein
MLALGTRALGALVVVYGCSAPVGGGGDPPSSSGSGGGKADEADDGLVGDEELPAIPADEVPISFYARPSTHPDGVTGDPISDNWVGDRASLSRCFCIPLNGIEDPNHVPQSLEEIRMRPTAICPQLVPALDPIPSDREVTADDRAECTAQTGRRAQAIYRSRGPNGEDVVIDGWLGGCSVQYSDHPLRGIGVCDEVRLFGHEPAAGM